MAAAAAAAVGLTIVLVVLRVFLPSILFIYGRAGSTPATELALYGLLPFIATIVVGPLATRLAGPRPVALGAAGVLVVSRLILQATDGGDPQLVVATVAVTAGFLWLLAVAAGALPPGPAVLGLVTGFALDSALHAALRTADLPWRSGAWPWLLTLAGVIVFAAATLAAEGAPAAGPRRSLPWALLGPAIVLHGMVTTPSRLHTVTDAPEAGATALLLGAHVIAVALAALAVHEPTRLASLSGALAIVVGVAAAWFASMPFERLAVVAGGAAVLVVGLALALSTAAWPAPREPGPGRAALSAALGLVALFVLAFGYYSGYDIVVPYPQDLPVVLAAGLVAVLALSAVPWRREAEQAQVVRTHATLGRGVTAGAVAATVVAASAAVATLVVTVEPAVAVTPDEPIERVRVMTYNLHMGFDPRGRFDVDAMADVIAAEDPDVVALQEVARGWFVNGSTDVLPRLAERLGMPYVFAPAADAVWGNALLSRYPVVDARVDPLPREGVPMRRSALSAAVQLGDGLELGVIATHLHHLEEDPEVRRVQAQRVAAIAREFTASDLPVVVMGDFNAQPEDPELEPLADELVNASALLGGPPTAPAWDPEEAIDHIYVSSELDPSSLAVPPVAASDHLAVALTVAVPTR